MVFKRRKIWQKNVVDYLFLFLVSTGFAKSFFRSLKSSFRSLISFLMSVVLFSILFLPLKSFVLNQAPFKQEFLELVLGGFGGQEAILFKYENQALLSNAISLFGFPQLIRNILFVFVGKASILSIGGVIGEALYQFLLTAIVGMVLFVVISVGFHILLSFVFVQLKGGEGLFVTKRFFSGCLGAIKGVFLFLTIETALLSFAEVLSIGFIKDFVLSSSVGMMCGDFLSGAVLSLSQGLFWLFVLNTVRVFVNFLLRLRIIVCFVVLGFLDNGKNNA